MTSTTGLPPSCRDLLAAWRMDALALFRVAADDLVLDSALAAEAVSLRKMGTAPPPATGVLHALKGVTDTGTGPGPWAAFLAASGCRRALVLPLRGGLGPMALLVARAAPRPFATATVRQVERLAACLALARRVQADSGAGEVGELLYLSRRLALAIDLPALMDVLEDALDRTLEWSAFALLPGGRDTAALVRGGHRLDPASRRALERRLLQEAGTVGVAWGGAQWAEPPSGTGAEALDRAGSELLVLPLAADGGATGLLAVLATGPPPDEGQRRRIAALAQQTAPFLARWRQEREREHRRLAALLQAVPGGVMVVGPSGRVRACNAAAREMVHSLAGRAPDTNVDLHLPAGVPAAGMDVEFSSRRDQRTYAARWMPLPDGERSGGRIVTLMDVTAEWARQEQEIKVERMLALGEMLSGVAHELNNPLASVVGFSQLLLGQTQDEGTHRRLSIIAEEAQRARRIVHNLLDVARPRPPARVPVDVNELVGGILALFAYQFRLDGVRVEWTPGEGLPPVMGDRHQLQQVLVNLIANAQHALRDVRSDRVLHVQSDAAAGRVRLQVADTGPGIPATHLDRIFNRFFTTKEQGMGTGLGLSIAMRIVEDHGGTIHVRSQPAAGAAFTIDLPAGRPAPVATVAAAVPGEHPPGTRVLVVEDEASFRLLLQEALAQENYRVTTAAHGAAALEILAGAEFDAVVSDLRMPVMDGMQLFHQVQDQRPDLAGRFIFMTGDLLDQGTRTFLEGCGVTCLLKPFGLNELRQVLSRLPLR